jgi:hypothetical protein
VIEQHYYTRTQQGYRTVARSENIDDTIEKNLLLPYCTFSAGEGGKTLTVVHYPCGRMLLGQAVHVPRAFFAHNYLIPPYMAEETLAVMFGVEFQTDYENQNGVLPSLDALPLNDNDKTISMANGYNRVENSEHSNVFLATDKTDSELFCTPKIGIDPNILTNLTKTLIKTVAANQKICIKTPVLSQSGFSRDYTNTPDYTNPHDYAITLLTELYRHLPNPLRHVLGFCTHTHESVNKKGIHLYFSDNPQTKGDFLMDFADKSDIINQRDIDEPDYLTLRYQNMPAQRFCGQIFDEINFWLVRESKTLYTKTFTQSMKTKMEQILQTNHVLPEAFIRQGLSGKYSDIIGFGPAAFVVHDILRQISLTQPTEENLRHIMGSYRLTPTDRERIFSHVLHS